MRRHNGPGTLWIAALVAGDRSGVGRYATALCQGVDRVAAAFPGLRVSLLLTPRAAEAVGARQVEVRTVGARVPHLDRGPVRLVAEQVALSPHRPDLVHFVDLSGPVLSPGQRFTTTVHDGKVVRQPGSLPGLRGAYKRRLCPWAARHATAVLAISHFAGDEAVAVFGADPRRIRVVHSGPGFVAPSAGGALPREPFLLYAGALTQDKGVPMLVRAWARSGAPLDLVLAGGPGPGIDDVRREMAAAPRPGSVRIAERPSDQELDRLYRTATALALPSRYEGFGFTPLEAMSRGCPVVAGDIPAVREVAGEGSLLVPPRDEGAWAGALARIAADAGLREDLAARGSALVAGYSWDATAMGALRLACDVLRVPYPPAAAR